MSTSPGMHTIGGFTITSIPAALPLVELAVKASPHPPARWITEEAVAGDAVQIRVGGSFGLPSPRPASSVFIAGGVGITPLYAMVQQLFAADEVVAAGAAVPRAVLLYSAVSRDELLFASTLEALSRRFPERFRLEMLTTREASASHEAPQARAGRREISEALGWLQQQHARSGLGGDEEPAIAFVCGPKGMPEAMVDECGACGIQAERVRFEKWW